MWYHQYIQLQHEIYCPRQEYTHVTTTAYKTCDLIIGKFLTKRVASLQSSSISSIRVAPLKICNWMMHAVQLQFSTLCDYSQMRRYTSGC